MGAQANELYRGQAARCWTVHYLRESKSSQQSQVSIVPRQAQRLFETASAVGSVRTVRTQDEAKVALSVLSNQEAATSNGRESSEQGIQEQLAEKFWRKSASGSSCALRQRVRLLRRDDCGILDYRSRGRWRQQRPPSTLAQRT